MKLSTQSSQQETDQEGATSAPARQGGALGFRDSRTFRAAVIAFGQGANALVGILIASVLSRNLTKLNYATYQQTMLVYTFVAPLIGLGLPAALLYFLPRNPERGRTLITEVLLLLSSIGVVFSALLYFGGADLIATGMGNPALAETLRWFALYPLFALPITALHPCLVATHHVERSACFTIVGQLLRLVLVCTPILLIAPSPLFAVQASVVVAAILFVPGMVMMYLAVDKGDAIRPSVRGTWDQLKYAFPLGVSSILGMLTVRTDKLLVGAMLPAEDFAVYVNGAMEVPLIGIITGSVAATILPDLVRLHDSGDVRASRELWIRGGLKAAYIMLPVAVFLFVAAPELMTLIYDSAYVDSSQPFRIYVCALPFRVVMYGAVLQAAGLSSVILKRTALTLVLNFVLSIALIKVMGANGAAWGTLLSSVGFAVPYNLAIISKVFRVSFLQTFPFVKLLVVLVASLIGNLPSFLILKMLGYSSVVGLGLSFVCSAGLCLLVFEISGFVKTRELTRLLVKKIRSSNG